MNKVTQGLNLDQEQRFLLFKVAFASIECGLLQGRPLELDSARYPPALGERRACFVTLMLNGKLRGCIGSLEPSKSLVEDVAQNGYRSAFSDPRFPPLTREEFEQVEMSISTLSLPESLNFISENDLIGQLRPGRDGLILEEGQRQGTFLPVMWETLADPRTFLRQLKQKAGLPGDYWSASIKIRRYTAETIVQEGFKYKGIHLP